MKIKVDDMNNDKKCIYGPCSGCVFSECLYTEEEEFEDMGRG